MKYDEFLARVRELGEYRDRAETEQVTESVLRVLASRITPGEAKDLAAQLSGPLGEFLAADPDQPPESFGTAEFCRRVAGLVGATPRTAEWDASAVLSTVADAVTGGELNQVLSQLPSSYATLFGKPELGQ
jgi:uncharacterized protein (DUF2267 family)